MKKILLIVPYNYGTIGLVSYNLYKGLCLVPDTEVKVALVYDREDGTYSYDNAEVFSSKRILGLLEQLNFSRKISWLRKIKRSYQPQLTISTLFGCSTLNVLSGGKEFKIGIFHSPHQQVKAKGWLPYMVTLLIYNYIYPRLNKLFCVSQEVYNSINKHFPAIKQEQLEIVYNIHNVNEVLALADEKLNKEEEELFTHKVLLYCGRLDRNKAPDRLVRSLRKQTIPSDVHLVFMGNDTDCLWNQLEQMADEYGIRERIHYLGLISNPYKFMRKATALVSSSYSEGLPGVIIEALILNTPVITTNSTLGVWEILSCSKAYQKDLEGVYVASKGVITSNQSFLNTTKYDDDIHSMSDAIEHVLNHADSFKKASFDFEKMISYETNVAKYLENV